MQSEYHSGNKPLYYFQELKVGNVLTRVLYCVACVRCSRCRTAGVLSDVDVRSLLSLISCIDSAVLVVTGLDQCAEPAEEACQHGSGRPLQKGTTICCRNMSTWWTQMFTFNRTRPLIVVMMC